MKRKKKKKIKIKYFVSKQYNLRRRDLISNCAKFHTTSPRNKHRFNPTDEGKESQVRSGLCCCEKERELSSPRVVGRFCIVTNVTVGDLAPI